MTGVKVLTQEIHNEALAAAREAANTFFQEKLGGVDKFACGFAWVQIGVDGRSKFATALKKFGFRREYGGGYSLWNPSNFPCQNIDTLERGARAYAAVLKKYFPDYPITARSRLD